MKVVKIIKNQKSKIKNCLLGLMLVFFSCQEKKIESINAPTGKPEPVSNAVATPIPGGAIITFEAPKDVNILAIKAVYTTTNGVQREAITSFYGNTLTVEGYNDTEENEALLYTVSRAQELSDPVSVKFFPEESPLSKAVRTANIISDFGGAHFAWQNEDEVLLTVELLAANNDGALRTARIVSSRLENAGFSIRGFEPSPRKFGVIFSDNFDNVSDTIFPQYGLITPLLEIKLDKSGWSLYRPSGRMLPGDLSFTNFEGRDEYIWDDDTDTFGHSPSPSAMPVSLSIDLGKAAKLSRVVIHQRFGANGLTYYNWGNPKHVIVLGRLEEPLTDSWDEWTELIDFIIVKPSGTDDDIYTVTEEDFEAARNGHEADFPIGDYQYRYLRFRFVNSWENRPYAHPTEITLYGEYVE